MFSSESISCIRRDQASVAPFSIYLSIVVSYPSFVILNKGYESPARKIKSSWVAIGALDLYIFTYNNRTHYSQNVPSLHV